MSFSESVPMNDPGLFFNEAFSVLTGKQPFEWQRNAFLKFIDGTKFDRQISLPTGTGKTSFMQIWLVALAWQSMNGHVENGN